MIEDLKRKSFIAVRDFDHEVALKPEFPSVITAWCNETRPLMAFLCGAVGLDF